MTASPRDRPSAPPEGKTARRTRRAASIQVLSKDAAPFGQVATDPARPVMDHLVRLPLKKYLLDASIDLRWGGHMSRSTHFAVIAWPE